MGKSMKSSIRNLIAAALLGAASLSAQANNTVILGDVSPPFTSPYSDVVANTGTQFLDDYTFTLSPAGSFESVTATIDFGNFFNIGNLQARLYQGSGPFNSTTNPIEESWGTAMTAGSISSTNVVLQPVSLAASTYTLEIRGTATGSSGGSYAGVLSIVPIPEPGSYALMLAGLALVAGIASRRKLR